MTGRNKTDGKDTTTVNDRTAGQEQEKIRIKWHQYLLAVLFIIVGVLFIMFKEIDMSIVCKIFAAVFALSGIISIISYCVRDVDKGYWRLDLVSGVMSLFATLLFITGQEAVNRYFPVIAGAILLANGVIKLQHSIDMKRIDRKMKKVTEMWLVVMIFALIGIATGFITVYLTPENDRTMFILIGAALIVAGVSDVFTHIVFSRKVKLYKSGDYKIPEAEAPNEEPANDAAAVDAAAVDAAAQEEVVTPAASENETVTESPAPETVSDDDQVIFEVEMPKFSEENTDDADK